MTSPGRPPIADQIVAPNAFIPVPIMRKDAKADVVKPDHKPFIEDEKEDFTDAIVIERIVTNVRIISILKVFSPVCLNTMPLYVLYCSAVIFPDRRNWLSFSIVKALALAKALRSAPVI